MFNMFNEGIIKSMMEVYSNPLFKNGFNEFFQKMQKEGIEAARKFWNLSPERNNLFPGASELFEKLVDFYIVLGFVPRVKYDQVLSENKNLKDENKFLRDTIRELQFNLFAEGGEKVQQIWHSSIDKQLEMNKEIAKNFFELFRQLKVGSQ
jgi:hypothetical protein